MKTRIIILFVIFLSLQIFGYGEVINNNSGYEFVIATNLNVREKPEKNGKVIKQLGLGTAVKVLKRLGIKKKIGNIEGEWVYIDTRQAKNYSTRETVKGWVFNYYLSDLSEFRITKKFDNYSLDLKSVDIAASYIFKKNGEFIHKYFDYESNKFLEKKGKIYKYRNVYIAEVESGRLFMIQLKNGDILSDAGVKLKNN